MSSESEPEKSTDDAMIKSQRDQVAGTRDKLLEALRREFEESGMSEEELTRFLTEVRDEVRRGKQMSEG
jgi:transcriptional regulator NrdR family protein